MTHTLGIQQQKCYATYLAFQSPSKQKLTLAMLKRGISHTGIITMENFHKAITQRLEEGYFA